MHVWRKGAGEAVCRDACSAPAGNGSKPASDGKGFKPSEDDDPETVDIADDEGAPTAKPQDDEEDDKEEGVDRDEDPDDEGWTEEAEEIKQEQIDSKNCIGCWEEQAERGFCEEQLNACEESLACTQLQWCPVLCEEELRG